MKTIRIVDVLRQGSDLVGKEVNVKGWVRTKRGNSAVNFIALNDGSTVHSLQVVADVANFDAALLKQVTTAIPFRRPHQFSTKPFWNKICGSGGAYRILNYLCIFNEKI